MKKIFLVFLLFFLASCVGRSIDSADRVFIARVVFPDGTLAENAEVSLYAKSVETPFAIERTNSKGLADFGELPVGLYTIKAAIENYVGARKCNVIASYNPTYTCRVRLKLAECNQGERNCITETDGEVCIDGTLQDLSCPESTFCSVSKESKACVACRDAADCAAGQICKGWECITPQECSPFERQCLSATTGKICGAKGFWGESFDCAPWGRVCSVAKDTKPCA